jgi:hypothetical protein
MVVLMVLMLVNCKNVVQRDEGMSSPPPKWLAQGCPRVRYKVLVVGGVGSATKSVTEEPSGRHLSLHIVRGHFATYTPGKPLFGKFVGQFWIPQHARGDESVGTVHKSYKVEP